MLMDLKANQRRGCSGDNEVLIPGCFLYELWWDAHYFNSASLHLFQCIAIFSINSLDYWLRENSPESWQNWPQSSSMGSGSCGEKNPREQEKNLYHAFCVFLGCPAKSRWKILKGAADSNFFCWHKQTRNKSHLKLSWPLPRTICLTCKEENASVSVHTFTGAT